MLNSPQYRKAQQAAEKGRKRFKVATCKTHFFVRSQVNVIVFRVSVNGRRSNNKSTGVKATPEGFDPKTLIIQNDPDSTIRLHTLANDVQRVFKEREITGRSLDPTVIRDIALGLRAHDKDTPTVIEAINIILKEHETRIDNNDLALRSWKRYKSYSQTLIEFFTKRTGYGADVCFDELNSALEYHLMNSFLKGEKKYCHDYAVKIFQYFRQIIRRAVAEGWADRNPIDHVRLRKQRKSPVTLTMADLAKLKALSLTDIHTSQVRDVFLFACYTGLAYADLKKLKSADVVTIKDVPSLLIDRKKSGVQAFVPLFPEARLILDKYSTHEGCQLKGVLLPVLSNPKMNQWLKVIGSIAGIKEPLHTHLGRKTFTMYSEELGFTLTEMATMLGHTDASMTESHYYQRRREPVIKRFKEIFRNTGNIQDELNQKAS